ncbi:MULTISPECIES: hypothetical protein [Acinetobacter]|jgi:hypothetical protein|uniref:Alpha/beta hydrolase n=1 Tax=Acinetobacter pittii TaxID=48296 RepID=A0AAE9MA31_ACIPI|nr:MULTISPECIES: hypothetical protein [Acinetobacter calcoaceticus/baumannii complex]AZP27952.1 hypothetical protein DLK06_01930 [Acinetobacter pittii]EXE25789.1 hypothetical protein J569_2771 [Acinetobacter sp. 907131]EXS10853.1 hypothetical protein J672_3839 [Acinetobacter sp. 883425]MBK0410473.1 hypothetical protein [Acinetobacter pittii]MBK1416610.1 hypothetical protein [Acinetobacter pittii]
MDKQIIFEDEHIRAIFLPGDSNTLVLSFGDLITRASGLSINAEKSLIKYQYNVIGVMPKQKSWFPQASMIELAKAISPILEGFKNIVGYGGSMGGYAAIKYSNLLNMNRVIAFVPQYSIDPEHVEDRRYAEFFDSVANKDMQIQPQDVDAAREYVIVYDPYFSIDREHYLKIKELLPSLHTIHLPFTGHEALSVLASSSLLHDFIEHDFDEIYFYQQVRKVKKQSKFYFRNVLAHVLTQHDEMLLKILRQNDFQLDERYFDNPLKQAITRSLIKTNQATELDFQKLGIKVLRIQEDANYKEGLQTSFGLILVFNLINSKFESYTVDTLLANKSYLVPIVAEQTGVVNIELNNEIYLLAMNDRKVIKLFKSEEPLTSDMSPFLIKKYFDCFAISYKQLNLSCDEQGLCEFTEGSIQPTEQLTTISY